MRSSDEMNCCQKVQGNSITLNVIERICFDFAQHFRVHKVWLQPSARSCYLCSWFTHKDTNCTSTAIIPSAPGNISLQKWGGLRWPSVTRVTGAKRVSKCDKSCWALSSQVPFVHSHLHTKEALCQRRQYSGGGYGWFNNNMVVFYLKQLEDLLGEIYLVFYFGLEKWF